MAFCPGEPSLLANIRALAPPHDPTLLQALLTCIVAQDAHLIIRTSEDDLNAVVRLLVSILSSLLAYPTHKLKIRPSPSHPPSHRDFLRSLFLPPSPSSSGSQDESSDPNRSFRTIPRRSRNPRNRPISPIHSSLSNPSSKPPITSSLHPETGSHVSTTHPGNSSLPQLPRALVISGLENTPPSSQKALAQVLSDKLVVLDNPIDGRGPKDTRHRHEAEGDGPWQLPDGFIAVYVCSLDPRERPHLHNSLLDKFAMSCNVLLKPHIRNALQPISPNATARGAHSSLPSRPPLHRRQSQSHLPALSTAVLPPGLMNNLHQARAKTHISPTLSLYLADLFSATQHHAQLDGTLLTARCVQDAEKLARAARVLGVDPTGVELLRGGEHDQDEENEFLDEYESTDAAGSLRKSTGSVRDRETLSESQRPTPPESSVPVLGITEVNIAWMFPRCVSRRLRVLDGPREEVFAGAVFGATFDDLLPEEMDYSEEGVYVDAYEVRPTVKDILASIMSEV